MRTFVTPPSTPAIGSLEKATAVLAAHGTAAAVARQGSVGAVFLRICLAVVVIALLTSIAPVEATAQFEFGGQFLNRPEYRHGYGKLIPDTSAAAGFISQRLRIQGTYTASIFTIYGSIQDIRTWGSTSQLNTSDNFLSVHEAYGELRIDSSWKVKVGRQEMVYDNSRFLGNVDWAMQARSHDFLLVKFEKGASRLHFGAGYNQDGERLSGNTFLTPNQYKVAQMAWYGFADADFELSALMWNNGVQYNEFDASGAVTYSEVRYSHTLALPTIKYKTGNLQLSGFYYQQLGKAPSGKDLSAFNANVQASLNVPTQPESNAGFKLTLGGEILSGTSNVDSTRTSGSYMPLYGTNHMHNGYMDLFYVGGRHEQTVGLIDLFARIRYDVNSKVFLSLNAHSFHAQQDYYKGANKMASGLGTELDFTAGWVVVDEVSLQFGYSMIFASETLQAIQGVSSPATIQNWAYLMLVVRPDSKNKFVGLLF